MHRTCRERQQMHVKFWLESLRGRNNLENLGIDNRIILKTWAQAI
jgi:hypothetical protein